MPGADRLLAYALALQRATTYDELLAATGAEILAVTGYRHLWLFVADDPALARMRLIATAGDVREVVWEVAPILTIAGDAMLEEIVRAERPVVVADARTDPRTDKAIVDKLGNRTIINVPLRRGDEPFAAYGTGTFGDEGVRAPTAAQLDELVAIGVHLAVALVRVRAVDELLDSARRTSAGNYRAILETAHEGFVEMDQQGRIVDWNPEAEAIFGWPRAEVIGRRVADTMVPPGLRDAHTRGLYRYLATGSGIILGKRLEMAALHRDGHTLPVELTVSPIKTDGAPRFAAFVRDITERRRSEDALARARDDAETTMREYEAFSYSVAHDLRAPLRGISGFSAALLEDHAEALGAEGQRLLGKVVGEARRMAELIDALLGLARVTRADFRRGPVQLSVLARATVARLVAQDDRPGVEVAIADGLDATGDARLLGIVLDNLIGNAWKFTAKRHGATIEVGVDLDADHPVYFVRDNGAGFDMAYAAKLFGVFQRLHSAGEFDGTGIGLATVQRIIRRHGGRVWATGAVGAGATFYFTLDERTERHG